jgi:hypothetical protein
VSIIDEADIGGRPMRCPICKEEFKKPLASLLEEKESYYKCECGWRGWLPDKKDKESLKGEKWKTQA